MKAFQISEPETQILDTFEIDNNRTPIRTVIESTSIQLTDHVLICYTVDGDITISLPDVSKAKGLEFVIQKADPFNQTITIQGEISGITNPQLSVQHQSISIRSNGATWELISGFNLFRTCEGSPYEVLVPQYLNEEVLDISNKLFYKATGITNTDWKLITNSYKEYNSGSDPNGNVTPDYIGQYCLVTYDEIVTWWKSKALTNNSWITEIDKRSAVAADDFLAAEETSEGSGIFHFVKKTLAQVRTILKLVTGATVIDNFVSFSDEAGGLKDSGKSASDFVASDDPRLIDNVFAEVDNGELVQYINTGSGEAYLQGSGILATNLYTKSEVDALIPDIPDVPVLPGSYSDDFNDVAPNGDPYDTAPNNSTAYDASAPHKIWIKIAGTWRQIG